MAGPGGSAPSGGVRFAPSGTFGAGAVSAGASDAGAPSSADADSVCAETAPVQSDAANAAPATDRRQHVSTSFPHLPSGSTGEPVSPDAQQSDRAPADRTTRQQTLLLFTKRTARRFRAPANRRIAVQAAERLAPVLCMMHQTSAESRSSCTMTRPRAIPRLFRMAGGCNLPEEFRSWRPVVSGVVEGRSDRW